MNEYLLLWIERIGLADNEGTYLLVVLSLLAITALIVHVVLHVIVLRFLGNSARAGQQAWRKSLFGHNLFTRLALVLQGVIFYAQARIWLQEDSVILGTIEVVAQLWVILFTLLSLFSLLNVLEEIYLKMENVGKLPLRGIFQSVKLVGACIAVIVAVALVIGESPMLLFSGLGAMTAVVLLIFKDPILGLMAGIQLSANNMLAVGDWLEMPKYGADGDVIDISLTTVKVRNWDKTITAIPSYSLISDSFKNWRNIEYMGGRRIKRAINVDAASIRFLNEDDLARLRKAQLLTSYIESKLKEIERDNNEQGIDPSSPVNGRKLTNLGIFRAYLTAYLGANKHINHDLTHMVRQLAPGPQGIPLEIYGFCNNTSWVPYEAVQSDIFDHVFAVISEFGLRLYQAPSGIDVR
ncbi:MAG: mechanosensitive ion channel domain-containing protein, partial [Pseudohongiellaceae bacterium]